MYPITVSAFILPITVCVGMIIQHVFTTEQNKKSQYHNVGPHQGVGSPFQMKKIKPTLTSKSRRGDSQKILACLNKRFFQSALDGSDFLSSTFFPSSSNGQSSHSEMGVGHGSECHQDACPKASENLRMSSAVS